MILDLFLSRRIDQRNNKYKNINYFKLLGFRVIYDIISIFIFSIIGYLILLFLGVLIKSLGIDYIELGWVRYIFEFLNNKLNLSMIDFRILSMYNVRIVFLIVINIYYLISKIIRSSLIRGKKGTLSNSMNVQLSTIIPIRILYLIIKVTLEIIILILLNDLLVLIIDVFINIKLFNFGSELLDNQLQTSYIIFFVYNVLFWHLFTKPLWYAKLRSKNYEGNYVFSFYGCSMYVGNADDGVSSRLTKYYNNKGASDTAKIYYRRFYLRVFYIYTLGIGKLFENLLYVLLGAPLINTKNTWGHIR